MPSTYCGFKRVAQGATLLAALTAAVLLWPTWSAPEPVAGSVFVGAGRCRESENPSAPLGAFGMPVGWKRSRYSRLTVERERELAGEWDDPPDVASCALACQEAEEGCTGFYCSYRPEDGSCPGCYLVTQTVAVWSSTGDDFFGFGFFPMTSLDLETVWRRVRSHRSSTVCYAKGHDAQIESISRGEALFFVTNALPTLCALASLLVFALRDYQRAAQRQQQAGQAGGVIVVASPKSVGTCVLSLLAKLTAGAALPIWIGVMCWFGGEWVGSSLIAGLIVEPALVLACTGGLAVTVTLLMGGVSELCDLVSGHNDSPPTLKSLLNSLWDLVGPVTGVGVLLSLAISLVYLLLGWMCLWFIVKKNDGFGVAIAVAVGAVFCVLKALDSGEPTGWGPEADADEKEFRQFCATVAFVYLAWFAVLLLKFVLGDDSGLFQHIDEDDVPFWSFSLLQVSLATFYLACGILSLGIVATVVGFVGTVLCRGVATLCRAMGITNCSCFDREIAMLRACCCPQKIAVATPAIVPSQEQSAHSSTQEAQSQSEAAPLLGWEGDNGPSAEAVDDYARNVLGMDVEKHPHLIWIAEEALLQIDLPKGWVERIDATGRAFYENKSTKETTYANPIDTTHRELYQLQVWKEEAKAGGQAPALAAGPVPVRLSDVHQQVETNCAPQAQLAAGPVPVRLSDVHQQAETNCAPQACAPVVIQVETNCAPQACAPVVIAAPAEAAQP